MTALAAGFGAALAGGVDEANAQASELTLPHPDGEIVIDVTRVALDTQMQILEQLQVCLQEGFEFADADGNHESRAKSSLIGMMSAGFVLKQPKATLNKLDCREKFRWQMSSKRRYGRGLMLLVPKSALSRTD